MKINQGKRGMQIESMINLTNQTYNLKRSAIVNKRPTPVKVMKSKGTRVLSGYFEAKSTVDYDGVYNGRAIYFEAKSTKDVRFPLKNIHQHQMDYMEKVDKAGALCFFLIECKVMNTVFLVLYSTIKLYWENSKLGGRKSIPIDDFNYYAAGEVKTQKWRSSGLPPGLR